MSNYVCSVCGYVYDPKQNENIPFAQLPDDWHCPLCEVSKDNFEEE
ncbi:MAG: rubredoxin [Clostridiales bacterium]|nr:rubredoxin [Clostridiales bacterium]